ncbi:MAG TPA: DUF4402 domain-containing protein [Lentimicrobium sp.]|jgi:hypothetical protein|nr:DUF4402 domain-containing protein [Lentimicrobium sp.]
MKKLIIAFSGIVVMTLASISANAQSNPAANASAQAYANIITPIAIQKNEGKDLKFGNIIASAAGGTVSIATNGSADYTGLAAPSVPGDRQAAEFLVSGFGGAAYNVNTAVVEDLTNGSNTMDLTLTDPATDEGTLGTLSGEGSQVIKIGGSIAVNPNQPAGQYTGSFTVTVNYQ